jgi:hypothetical protein
MPTVENRQTSKKKRTGIQQDKQYYPQGAQKYSRVKYFSNRKSE